MSHSPIKPENNSIRNHRSHSAYNTHRTGYIFFVSRDRSFLYKQMAMPPGFRRDALFSPVRSLLVPEAAHAWDDTE